LALKLAWPGYFTTIKYKGDPSLHKQLSVGSLFLFMYKIKKLVRGNQSSI